MPDYAVSDTGWPQGTTWGRVRIFSSADHKTVLKTFTGSRAGEAYGWSLKGPGDLNANGTPDILISTDTETIAIDLKFNFQLKALSGNWGPFEIVGDLNGDNKPDLLACAYRRLDAYSLPDLKPIHSLTTDYRNGGPRSGISLTRLDDVDGDGVEDFAYGEPYAPSVYNGNGLVRVVSGKSKKHLFDLSGEVISTAEGVGFGVTLDAADVDGDGRLDIVTGQAGQQRVGAPVGQTAWVLRLLPAMMETDGHTLSLSKGGAVRYTIRAPSHAGRLYFFAGFASGFRPGFSAWGVHIPLNIDPYFGIVTENPISVVLTSSFDMLDANGVDSFTRKGAPNLPATWKAITLDHAAVILSAGQFQVFDVTRNLPVTTID